MEDKLKNEQFSYSWMSKNHIFAHNFLNVEDMDFKMGSMPIKSTIAVILSSLWGDVLRFQIFPISPAAKIVFLATTFQQIEIYI